MEAIVISIVLSDVPDTYLIFQHVFENSVLSNKLSEFDRRRPLAKDGLANLNMTSGGKFGSPGLYASVLGYLHVLLNPLACVWSLCLCLITPLFKSQMMVTLLFLWSWSMCLTVN